MAKRRLTVRKIKEIIRLKKDLNLSDRQVGRSLNISHSTVKEYMKRVEMADLSYAASKEMSEAEINAKVFPQKKKNKQRATPDWQKIEKELAKKGVTRMLLWQEYIEENPEGYQYSQFCDLYKQWVKAQDKPEMRHPAKAGERVQVDYTGLTMQIIDPQTGEIHKVEIFVGVIGASGLIYTEAHWKQSLTYWTQAHVRMFNFFGGVPEIIVPDNLKAGVKSPNYYEPDINPTYHELAEHYGVAVIPARVRKPQDKGLVENAVQQVERWVLAPLRNKKFFSLNELNQSIKELLEKLNNRKRSDNGVSRRELFEKLDRAELRTLPDYPFEYSEIKYTKVHIDYHVTFKKHHYSVPFKYCRKKVLIRATEKLIEIYSQDPNDKPCQRVRIASHPRIDQFGYSTQNIHMPANHRSYLEWSPERFIKWARKYGESTEALISGALESRKHPQQAFRNCLGILNLAKAHGEEYLELACKMALITEIYSYKAIKHILENKKDMLVEEPTEKEPLKHKHVRGNQYYN
ncbi:MAG: IS21 family transposase [Anaerolineaceae bacterium]|nr:IS21 family transposase [Anaerolineaceae bacterium]